MSEVRNSLGGRPKMRIGDRKVKTSITVSEDVLRVAKILGEGNASKGIERHLSLLVPVLRDQIDKLADEEEEILN